MKVNFKPVVLAAVLASSALLALAQSGPGPVAGQGPGPGMHQPEGERHARHEERLAKRAADLKAKLKLAAEQESNWNTFMAAMKPAARVPMPKPEDMARLSTPERLDKLSELRKQRDAVIEQRDAATRSFYSSLNADQKKVFDESMARSHRHGPHRGHG